NLLLVFDMNKKYLIITLIIIGLLFGGWATAQDLSSEEKEFRDKLKHYLKKAREKIIPALEKPLNKLNKWIMKQLVSLKPNLYEELEEMKKSLLDLFKWGWQEGTEKAKEKL
ncbi:MAG: hypothetical protein V5A57_02625, partial [Candidatus Paceibacterota bacterium]